MKKSEMIKALAENFSHVYEVQIHAETIIDFLVSQGLQPPDYVKETENSAGKWRERVYCAWEPEE